MSFSKEKFPYAVAAGVAVTMAAGLALYSYMSAKGDEADDLTGAEKPQGDADDKYVRYPGITNDFSNPLYDAEHTMSIERKEEFWAKQAKELTWTKFPTKILDTSHQYLHRWYTDGEMNICYNAVDRHVEAGRGAETALLYDSAYTGAQDKVTYREL